MKYVFLVFVFSFVSINAQVDNKTLTDRVENTASNMFNAAYEATGWYDLAVLGLMTFRNKLLLSDEKKPFRVSPFDVEEDIQTSVGISGHSSPGSMSETLLPEIILYTRLGATVAANLIDPGSVDKNNYKGIFLFYKSIVYTRLLTNLTKNYFYKLRPDKSDSKSFFSGHTSTTFASSTFLFLELDDFLDDWTPTKNDKTLRTVLKAVSFAALYGWAGYVGYSRMKDNKHYLVDVLLGAAVGTTVSYFVHDFYLDDDDTILDNIGVTYQNNTPMVSLNLCF